MSNITNQPVKFIACTDVQYDALANKENNAIYFVSGSNNNYRICLGETCYNVDIITSLDGTTTDFDVPSSHAVKTALNDKVNRPNIETIPDTTLPATITPLPDHEYRYTSLTYSSLSPTTAINVSISTDYLGYYYTSLILHGISFTGSVSDFIIPTGGTGLVDNIIFLNDANLSSNNTTEILLFSNGIDICCISNAYNHPVNP